MYACSMKQIPLFIYKTMTTIISHKPLLPFKISENGIIITYEKEKKWNSTQGYYMEDTEKKNVGLSHGGHSKLCWQVIYNKEIEVKLLKIMLKPHH